MGHAFFLYNNYSSRANMKSNSYVCLEENTSKVYTVPYSNETINIRREVHG